MKNIKLISKIVTLLFLVFSITSCDKKAVAEVIDKIKAELGIESITLNGKVISEGSQLEVAGGKRHSIKFKFSDNIDFKENLYTIKEIDDKGNPKDVMFFWRKFNPEEPKTAEVKFDAFYGKQYQITAKGTVEFKDKDEKYEISKTINIKSSDEIVEVVTTDNTTTTDTTMTNKETVGGDGTPEITISQPAPSRGVLVIEANYDLIGRSTAVYKSDNEFISAKGFEMIVNVGGTEIVRETYDKFANTIKLMKSEGGIFSLKINLDKVYQNQFEVYKKMVDGNTSVTFKVYDKNSGGKLLANITKEFNIKDVNYRYVYKPQNLDEAMNQLTFGTDYYFYVPDFSKDNRKYSMKYRSGIASGRYAAGADRRDTFTYNDDREVYTSTLSDINDESKRGNFAYAKLIQDFKFVKTGTVKASDLNLSQDILKKLKISSNIDYPVYNIGYTRGSNQIWFGSRSDVDRTFDLQRVIYYHPTDDANNNSPTETNKRSQIALIPTGNGKFYALARDFYSFSSTPKYRLLYVDYRPQTHQASFGYIDACELTQENLDRIASRSDNWILEVSFPEQLKWIKRYIGTKQGAIAGVPPMRIRSAFDEDASNCASNVKVTNTVGITQSRTTTTTTTEEKSFSLSNSNTLSTTDSRTTSTTEDHTASVSVTASAGFEAFGADVSVEVSAGYEYTNSKTQEFTSETGKENTSERSSENAKGREDSTEESVEISREISLEVEAKTTLRARTLYYQAENVKLPVEHTYQFSAVNVNGIYISGKELLVQLQQSPGWTGTVKSMNDTSITVIVPGTMTVDNIYYSKFTASSSGKCPE